MRPVVRPADSVFAPQTESLVKTAARGEAVDFDKYDEGGQPNPHHGWTFDFPEHVPPSERTYGNKDKAQGWYDDPENEPMMAGSKWGGTGDYADREFYQHTRPYSQATDPNREEVVDPSGALGQYGVGDEDLNEYHETGRYFQPGDQTGYPSGRGWDQRQAPYHVTPDSREREDADDETGRVFGLWHGGSNYSYADPREAMESFPSLGHAMRAVVGRYGNYNSGHEGERTTYNPATGTHHLTGDTYNSSMETPGVDRRSGMDIFHATPHTNGGWSINTEDEPAHRIWVNADGDAVVGREHGDYGMANFESDGDGEDAAGYSDHHPEPEPESSHPVQQHLVNAGFEYKPDPYNGDRYINEDDNGHIHTVRAPNPRYHTGTWHYEFHPHNEQDRDPEAPLSALTDSPKSLSFSARDPDEAYNLHKNLGNDLSELSQRGWGVQNSMPQNARMDISLNPSGSNHTIEAYRRNANDNGYDRIVKGLGGWGAAHIPDATPQNRIPPVTSIASSRSRRDVLDAADRHDSRAYLTSRAADRGSYMQDEGSGTTTWHIPHPEMGSSDFTVQSPGEVAHNPRWIVEHRNNGRIVTHTSHPNWVDARDELMEHGI